MDAAFRNIPVHPDDRTHTVIVWKDLAYVDANLAFGTSSSGGLFGTVADALLAIMVHRGIGPSLHWVDDYVITRSPTLHTSQTLRSHSAITLSTPDSPTFEYSYDKSRVYAVGKELGVAWKEEKTRPFAFQTRYIGFDWDIPGRSVAFPEEKRTRYREKVARILEAGRATRRERESVHGTLVHCALVSVEGRPRLPSIAGFAASFSHMLRPFAIRNLSPSVADDLTWWHAHLQHPISRSILPLPEPVDLDLWVDASTSHGIGVILDGFWDAATLLVGWKQHGRDISWAEMVALELGIRALVAQGRSHIHVITRSDNAGVIGAFHHQKSRSRQQNLVLQRLVSLLLIHDIHISLEYVQSKNNLADLPSRGIKPPRRIRASWLTDFPPPPPFLRRAVI